MNAFDFLDRVLLHIGGKDFAVSFFLVNLVLPLLLLFGIALLLKWVASLISSNEAQFHKKDAGDTTVAVEKKKKGPTKISKTINRLAFLIAIIIILRTLIILLSLKNILSVFTTPFFVSDTINISFFTIVQFIILIYVANTSSKFFSYFAQKYVIQYFKLENKNVLVMLVRYGVLVVVFFIGLPFIGIDVGSLNLVLGALGFGIGFGMQDLIANFIAGITINTSHVLAEDDRVIIQNIEGTVQQINMLNTVVRGMMGDELIIPNKFITSQPVHNFTHSDPYYFIGGTVSVSYTSDLHVVKKVMLEAAESLSCRVPSREIFFRVKAFEDSGISVAVFVCINDVSERYAAISDLNMRIWELFRDNDISIPYPQLDLHIKSDETKQKNSVGNISPHIE